MEPGFIGIIGGRGRMGRLMARLLEGAGRQVRTFDLADGPVDWRAAAGCRVLILAVPLPAMEQTCASLAPHLGLDHVVLDIGSVKEQPLRLMMEHFPGQVIGGHPLFGPRIDSFKDHLFFLCPGRPGPALGWFKDLLAGQGLRPVEIDPAQHDLLMARVQILRHMLLFSFGLALQTGQPGSPPGPEESGPWFNTLVEMLDRQIDLGPELHAHLAVHNPHTRQMAEAFSSSAQAIARAYSSKDQAVIESCLRRMAPSRRRCHGEMQPPGHGLTRNGFPGRGCLLLKLGP